MKPSLFAAYLAARRLADVWAGAASLSLLTGGSREEAAMFAEKWRADDLEARMLFTEARRGLA